MTLKDYFIHWDIKEQRWRNKRGDNVYWDINKQKWILTKEDEWEIEDKMFEVE